MGVEKKEPKKCNYFMTIPVNLAFEVSLTDKPGLTEDETLDKAMLIRGRFTFIPDDEQEYDLTPEAITEVVMSKQFIKGNTHSLICCTAEVYKIEEDDTD